MEGEIDNENPLKIAYNIGFLEDCIKHSLGEFTLNLGNMASRQPAIFESSNEVNSQICLLMPITRK